MPFFNRQVGTPRFKVAAPAATAAVPGTPIQLQYATVLTDPQGYWDAVNFRWVPKVSGWYNCSLNTTFASGVSTVFGPVVPQIRINGSTVSAAGIQPNLVAQSLNAASVLTALLQFNGSTDYLEGWLLYGTPISGAWVTPSNSSGANNCFLQAFYLGP